MAVANIGFRDSTTYRTPYGPTGGFTNGYEGNLRAHLLGTPGALLGHLSHTQPAQRPGANANVPPAITPSGENSATSAYTSQTYQSLYGGNHAPPMSSLATVGQPRSYNNYLAPTGGSPNPLVWHTIKQNTALQAQHTRQVNQPSFSQSGATKVQQAPKPISPPQPKVQYKVLITPELHLF
jgi:hypothetical protein